MGISSFFCAPRLLCSCIRERSTTSKRKKVVRIVKIDDGKVLEFGTPVLVKDVLVNLSVPADVVGSENDIEHLSPEYQLKVGKVYYIRRPSENIGYQSSADSKAKSSSNDEKDHKVVEEEEEDDDVGVKRVKVVITKQQLQELLMMKNISMEEVLLMLERKSTSDSINDFPTDSYCNWKPKLESIPEGNE